MNLRRIRSDTGLRELLGMERMPRGTLAANGAFFRIGILTYNVFVLFRMDLVPSDWTRHQVQADRLATVSASGEDRGPRVGDILEGPAVGVCVVRGGATEMLGAIPGIGRYDITFNDGKQRRCM